MSLCDIQPKGKDCLIRWWYVVISVEHAISDRASLCNEKGWETRESVKLDLVLSLHITCRNVNWVLSWVKLSMSDVLSPALTTIIREWEWKNVSFTGDGPQVGSWNIWHHVFFNPAWIRRMIPTKEFVHFSYCQNFLFLRDLLLMLQVKNKKNIVNTMLPFFNFWLYSSVLYMFQETCRKQMEIISDLG